MDSFDLFRKVGRVDRHRVMYSITSNVEGIDRRSAIRANTLMLSYCYFSGVKKTNVSTKISVNAFSIKEIDHLAMQHLLKVMQPTFLVLSSSFEHFRIIHNLHCKVRAILAFLENT